MGRQASTLNVELPGIEDIGTAHMKDECRLEPCGRGTKNRRGHLFRAVAFPLEAPLGKEGNTPFENGNKRSVGEGIGVDYMSYQKGEYDEFDQLCTVPNYSISQHIWQT